MPGAPKPNKAAAKIAYKILKTPKDLQQHNEPHATKQQKYEWFRDSSAAQ